MATELRITIHATIPMPDHSVFDKARTQLAVEEHIGDFGRFVVESDGKFTFRASEVTPKNRQVDDAVAE